MDMFAKSMNKTFLVHLLLECITAKVGSWGLF